ncbi:hypothetical protein GJ496_009553 [Pomphorhynchus laevis]|nr:hypothetical protein GJ496_010740 [Pomphorhynchus laevis]KAI0987338.1 hypothetical protein GJ496_009553 [Pomphorhynchus laevis]
MLSSCVPSNIITDLDILPDDIDLLCSYVDGVESLSTFQKTTIALIWRHLRFGTIPIFDYPNDLYLWSPTGSGKTLAFALPIMSYLRSQTIRGLMRVLVIVPNEKLVRQIVSVFRMLVNQCCDCIISTADEVLSRDCLLDIDPCVVISTLGMLGPLTRCGLNFNHLRFLVLDEADRLLHDSQVLSSICKNPPKNPAEWSIIQPPLQKVMVSATLDLKLTNIASIKCYEPLLIKAESDTTVSICYLFSRIGLLNDPVVSENLSEYVVNCSSESIKPLILKQLFSKHNNLLLPALVFTDSRKEASNLYKLLNQLLSKKLENNELEFHLCTADSKPLRFPSNAHENDIFICSDLMARGLDTCAVKSVIQYSVPKHLTTYIHRVGRTARVGKQGTAITLAAQGTEFKRLKELRNVVLNFEVYENDINIDELKNALQAIIN